MLIVQCLKSIGHWAVAISDQSSLRRAGQAVAFSRSLRQHHEENSSSGRIVLHPDCSAMSFNDGSRDGQAQPQAFPEALLALLHLMERMEDFFFVGIVDSRTGIGDSNQCKATGRIDRGQ